MLPRAFFSTATFKLQTSNPCAQALGAAPSDPIVQHCMCQVSTVPKHQMLSGCLQLCMCCSDVFCPNLETTRESERQRERERIPDAHNVVSSRRCLYMHKFAVSMPVISMCIHPSIHLPTYLPIYLFIYSLPLSLHIHTCIDTSFLQRGRPPPPTHSIHAHTYISVHIDTHTHKQADVTTNKHKQTNNQANNHPPARPPARAHPHIRTHAYKHIGVVDSP